MFRAGQTAWRGAYQARLSALSVRPRACFAAGTLNASQGRMVEATENFRRCLELDEGQFPAVLDLCLGNLAARSLRWKSPGQRLAAPACCRRTPQSAGLRRPAQSRKAGCRRFTSGPVRRPGSDGRFLVMLGNLNFEDHQYAQPHPVTAGLWTRIAVTLTGD